MFFLILTICTTAAMNDCQVHSINSTATEAQCLAVADVYRRSLGPETNYRIDCVFEESDDE